MTRWQCIRALGRSFAGSLSFALHQQRIALGDVRRPTTIVNIEIAEFLKEQRGTSASPPTAAMANNGRRTVCGKLDPCCDQLFSKLCRRGRPLQQTMHPGAMHSMACFDRRGYNERNLALRDSEVVQWNVQAARDEGRRPPLACSELVLVPHVDNQWRAAETGQAAGRRDRLASRHLKSGLNKARRAGDGRVQTGVRTCEDGLFWV